MLTKARGSCCTRVELPTADACPYTSHVDSTSYSLSSAACMLSSGEKCFKEIQLSGGNIWRCILAELKQLALWLKDRWSERKGDLIKEGKQRARTEVSKRKEKEDTNCNRVCVYLWVWKDKVATYSYVYALLLVSLHNLIFQQPKHSACTWKHIRTSQSNLASPKHCICMETNKSSLLGMFKKVSSVSDLEYSRHCHTIWHFLKFLKIVKKIRNTNTTQIYYITKISNPKFIICSLRH